MDEWHKAENGSVLKFETEGAELTGKFFELEESKQFPGSYLFKVKKEDGQIYGVFVSEIVKALIASNNIMIGQDVRLVYTGMKKTEDKKRSYKTYELYYR